MLTPTQLGKYIDARLTRSAFRLELLDAYAVDSDGVDFERFLRGEPEPTWERKQPWLDQLRKEKAAGIRNYRVHVLSTPLTDYLRYAAEWGYQINERAGDEVFIIDRSEQAVPDTGIDHDFWLIDDEHAIAMSYDTDGRFIGAEPVDSAALPRYRDARDTLLAVAAPFAQWWARHPEEWRESRLA